MPVDAHGNYRVPASPKQNELRELCRSRKKRFVLANGTRLSTKTMGCTFCVCDHAWEVKDANIFIITVTQGIGNDSGVWIDLQRAIKERVDGDFGFEWVREPYNEGVSKKPTCIVRNQFGQPVKIQLWSLKDEEEVEKRFKGPRATMIFVPELSTFTKEKTFKTWWECLRVPGELGVVRNDYADMPDNHLFLADTNPASEGEDSPIYRLWFKLLECEPSEAGDELALKNQLARMDFTLDDNIFDSKARLDLLKSQYSSDKDLYDRYIMGRWVKASTDAIFYGVFSEHRHVAPEIRNIGDEEILVPETGCFELKTGWDLGVRNCSVTFAEKLNIETDNGPVPAFKILDEHVVIGQDFILDEFIELIMDKMDYWERLMERVNNVKWTHWSDRNAFSVRDLSGRIYLNQAVYQASQGRITLQGAYDAQRGSGSVDARIDITRKLLHEGRIIISRFKCPQTIEMFKSLRRKKNLATGIAVGSKEKHPFDSGSYCWASECYEEMVQSVLNRTKKIRDLEHSAGLVQVPMR